MILQDDSTRYPIWTKPHSLHQMAPLNMAMKAWDCDAARNQNLEKKNLETINFATSSSHV